MKFTTTYKLYPDNKSLENAIANSMVILSKEFDDAALPDTNVTTADNFLHTRGNYEQYRFNTNILDNVREALEGLLTDDYRSQEPLAWAAVQKRLGNILAGLAQLQSDKDLYQKAFQCFKHALEIYNQQETPLDWAATQADLGTVLQALGRQESDSKILNQSIDAYTEALLEYTRKDTPQEWATVMFQLASTFHEYGTLLKGNRTFQKSVVSYKNALAELDADNYAFELAATHNNRGSVLQHLAESEQNAGRMQEAIRSFETALTICMEQQLPIHLAVLCRVNRATAQSLLSELTEDTVLADEVADECEVIIECFPHALQPLCLKYCDGLMNKMREVVKQTTI